MGLMKNADIDLQNATRMITYSYQEFNRNFPKLLTMEEYIEKITKPLTR